MRAIALAIISLFLIGAVASQEIDTVILATDTNAPDLYAASAAGTNEGIPVIVTEGGELTSEIQTELTSLGVDEVVIVGGPLAVDTGVEEGLENAGYDVTRLAGVTATGTGVEIADHFFPDDIDCAVLVEHTDVPETDFENHMDASNLASEEGCPMIPVPTDDVPSSVLEFLQKRNITKIRYIARTIRNEVRERLSSFNLTEIVGSRETVRNWVRNRVVEHTAERIGDKPMIVVVAAPFWNDSLNIGSRPMEYTILWRIASTDEIQDLIDYINANNITMVKIQGTLDLVTEIYNQLTPLGIDVSRFSKASAWGVVKDVIADARDIWEQRKANVTARRLAAAVRIRERVQERIDAVETRLNSIEAEIDSMEAEGQDVTTIRSVFNNAKSRLTTAKSTLASDWERARYLISQTDTDVLVQAWDNNIRGRLLNIDERIREETQSIVNARDRLIALESEMRDTLTNLAATCNRPILVRRLVDRAKDLKDQIVTQIQDGNYGRAAVAVGSAQELLRMAKSLEVACQNRGTISSSIETVVESTTAIANSTIASITSASVGG